MKLQTTARWGRTSATSWSDLPQPRRSPFRRSTETRAGADRDATTRDPRLARLEAVLLVSREAISTRRLAQFAGLLDGTEARTLVRALNRLYDREGYAFRAEEVAGGFQLMTRAKFAPWLRRLFTAPVETRLSSPAMETLAVIAYRQPAPRATIDAIRGVDSGEIVRQLIERDLVRITGRSDELGRPYLYGTTKRFLQIFGLRHLDDLPRAGILRAPQRAADPTGDRPIPDRTADGVEKSPAMADVGKSA